jgi:hypothetical protein
MQKYKGWNIHYSYAEKGGERIEGNSKTTIQIINFRETFAWLNEAKWEKKINNNNLRFAL